MNTRVESILGEILPSLVALRHELHAHPELGFEERETSQRVFQRLNALPGLTIRRDVAKTGLVATLGADKKGRCVALRADMDALPIVEETGLPYASKTPGRMHACGHDGHMTCLIGAAEVLTRMSDDLPGPVKFIFQPAEEGLAGGKVMVEEGALDAPKVDAIFALHGWPTLKVGAVGTGYGATLASATQFEAIIRGKGCHAAYPHQGIDPILIAAHAIVALQSIASRYTDPVDTVVVTVARVDAGTVHNVIPESVKLLGTVRALRMETRNATIERVKQMIASTAATFGGSAEVRFNEGYPVLINDRAATDYLVQTARSVIGDGAIIPNEPPSMGGEDFSFFAQRVPANFWRLGTCPKDRDNYPGLHHPRYDFTDDAIPVGVRMHCAVALDFAKGFAAN